MNGRRPSRTLRRLVMAGGAALALTTGCTTAGAEPGYVFYYHAFGDWTVICALDEPTGRKDCRLGAPDPSATGTAAGADVTVDIVDAPDGETAVVLRIRGAVETGRPALLKADGGARHQAALTRTGEAVWRGAEARTIVDEMVAGQAVSIRFIRQGELKETERRFSLVGFALARQTYRQRLAAIAAESR
ncbi:hypothetical protein [Shumkonia mesophila]|uniref:hypothetical protein n=1 Tax=Shumkonia mesophila TaxID=2838854 RepID=UPI0029343822|nr:hypothetical protein [Shumkonia mesophila]